MTALVTCPACGDMHEAVSRWCPNCGKWLRLTGPTASELYQRRKAQSAQVREDCYTTGLKHESITPEMLAKIEHAAQQREDTPPHKERMI